jgi:hypothetical protein
MPNPMAARTHKTTGALLIVGSLLGLVGNALHPHVANVDAAAVVRAIGDNGAWVAIHLAIIVAILLIIGGLIGLSDELAGTPGELLARLGLGAALLGGAVVTVSSAIDGFVMKALAISLAGGAGGGPATALQIAIAVKTVDFGIWSIGILAFFGATFGCFGFAILASRRYPARYGWVPIVGAAGSSVAALLQIALNGESQAAESIFLASSLLLTLWTLALGARLWRRGAPVPIGPVVVAAAAG